MLNELEGLQLGPIFLSFQILSMALSGVVAYFTFAYFVKKNDQPKSKDILDKIQTSFVIFLIVFKMLPIVFHPSLLLTPSKLLIYSGGPYAIQISAIVSLGYFLYYFYKEKWSIKLVDHFAVACYVYLIVSSLLIKTYGVVSPFSFGWTYDGTVFHPVNFYYAVLSGLFLISVVILFSNQKKGVVALLLLLAFFLIEAILTPFSV